LTNRTSALSLVPNASKLGWAFQAGLTVARYEGALVEQKKAGRRPLTVMSEVVEGEVRYTVVWIEYSPER
jgi:hypothetical protein